MTTLFLVVFLPFAGAAVLAAIREPRLAGLVLIAVTGATLAAALALPGAAKVAGAFALIDELTTIFVVLNAFVGFTTALASRAYVAHEVETGRLAGPMIQVYHALFAAMLGAMNLALTTNNIGLMWVGLELGTLIAVVMVGIYRTPAAIEAAWKYFILGSVGISLAFFGTILIYLAGQGALGEGMPALTFSRLAAEAGRLDPALVNLAFVFLLVGYGTKVGLVPLHAWLPDAHSEGPTPIAAVLSGLLLNVALYALLRFKTIVAGQPAALDPGPVMMAAGALTLVFAALMLYQRRDVKRLFAYSSIEHMGLMTFAFGLGGKAGNLAGLLHVIMHGLTKSAIFMSVGPIAQMKGSQRVADIRGLSVERPGLALVFGAGVLAIAGLPPFGVFLSEFLVVTAAFARSPWLAGLVAAGLILAFGALIWRLQDMLLGEPSPTPHRVDAPLLPAALHLVLVATAGLHLPGVVTVLLERAAALLP